jgi:hypothetical protein
MLIRSIGSICTATRSFMPAPRKPFGNANATLTF